MSKEEEFAEVRYIEVPRIEYKEIYVPKIQTVEVEKRVPKVEVVEIEKEVEVLQIHNVTREVERVIEQEVVKHVPRREVVEVPVEIIKEIPRIETVVREETVSIPGEIIEVPRTVRLEQRVPVPVYHNRSQETVVAQSLQPTIRQIPDAVAIPAVDYDPVLCKVIIPIPKPVPSPMFWGGKLEDRFRYVAVPPRQYNGLIQAYNRHLPQSQVEDLFVRNAAGYPIPPIKEMQPTVPPLGPVEGPKPPTPYISSPNVMAPPVISGRPPAPSHPASEHIGSEVKGANGAHSGRNGRRPKPTMEEHWHSPKGTWLGHVTEGFGRDTDADRYYREHHDYFIHAMQTPRKVPGHSRQGGISGRRATSEKRPHTFGQH